MVLFFLKLDVLENSMSFLKWLTVFCCLLTQHAFSVSESIDVTTNGNLGGNWHDRKLLRSQSNSSRIEACSSNSLDLVLVIDTTLSNNVWRQDEMIDFLQSFIIDIINLLNSSESDYSIDNNTNNVQASILFQISIITYNSENVTIVRDFSFYSHETQKEIHNFILYDVIPNIAVESPQNNAYPNLKDAIGVLVNDIYSQSENDDILITLLLTDEYAISNDGNYSLCNDNDLIDSFYEKSPLFGIVLIDEYFNITNISMALEPYLCLISNPNTTATNGGSGSFSLLDTTSDNATSFLETFYQSIFSITIDNFDMFVGDNCTIEGTLSTNGTILPDLKNYDFDILVPLNSFVVFSVLFCCLFLFGKMLCAIFLL